MCLHVYMCLVLAMGPFDTCTFGVLYMYTCIGCWHTVWFLPTVCHLFFTCDCPFADAIFCAVCSVYIICYIMIC